MRRRRNAWSFVDTAVAELDTYDKRPQTVGPQSMRNGALPAPVVMNYPPRHLLPPANVEDSSRCAGCCHVNTWQTVR